MNYQLSKKILEEVKGAGKILINCHINPDPDGVGSAIALSEVLSNMGKDVTVVSSVEINELLNFLDGIKKIKVVDYSDFEFSAFDLFISLDSSSLDRSVGVSKDKVLPTKIINIDHHSANQMFGEINLVDEKLVSVAELLFRVFMDWGVDLDASTATALLTGIIGDSGAFRFPGTTSETFKTACDLMARGADKNKIIFNIYFSYRLEYFKFWSEVLKTINFDEEYGFVWSAIPYEVFAKCGAKMDFKEVAASLFFESVKDSNFGLLMVEQEKAKLGVSFRSRTGFDTSEIARALGGGGHVYAAGATIEGLSFDKAVEKVLEVAKHYAKKNK